MENRIEDGGFPSTSQSSNVDKTYTEIFDEVCPYYMSIGVTYEEFWYGDFAICKYARQAEKLRRKRTNQEMWWNAIYMFRTMLDVAPAFRDFGDGKKTKISFSTEQPFPMDKQESEEIEKAKHERQKEEFLSKMLSYTQSHNLALKQNGEQKETEK